ncbi:polar amino acid transport system substrate-binding protein [Marinomonas polaris DSM 16579]|uniref:Polar amino acid transport system substrate-binding protein n=1 Tax=Marinomonas polaris DSM 16579 TaxID=1122206 RepID=A0A1M5EB12_9GAMM|nr:transporter substrate-binding domain-containing protein [Marinomonas polaris]SHF76385.1 polar amino acid transport system substrate-binding protein [Marinomonas polaris DSM 16579]
MRDNKLRILSFLMFFWGACVSSISYATTLKVCYDQWPPMTMFPTKDEPERGVVIDMVEQIYSSEGFTLEYFEVPLARGLDMVAEGLCDMLPEYLYSKNSDNVFVYASEATFSYATAFVVRKSDSWRYQGIQSLNGKRIATGPGWDYSSMSAGYQHYIDDPANSNFVEVIAGYDDVVDRIFHMIKEDRVDLYADNDLVLQYVLNQLDLNDDLRIVRPGLEKKLVEMPIFSKKIPTDKRQELINIWNEGRLAMKGKKEQALLNKYEVSLEK